MYLVTKQPGESVVVWDAPTVEENTGGGGGKPNTDVDVRISLGYSNLNLLLIEEPSLTGPNGKQKR